MGMFDTFYTTAKVERCPEGHKIQRGMGWQTKEYECGLHDLYLGDKVFKDDCSIWCYAYCLLCEKMCGRYMTIKNRRYVDFSEITWEVYDGFD